MCGKCFWNRSKNDGENSINRLYDWESWNSFKAIQHTFEIRCNNKKKEPTERTEQIRERERKNRKKRFWNGNNLSSYHSKNFNKLFVKRLVILFVWRRVYTNRLFEVGKNVKSKSLCWWAICWDDLHLIEPLFPTSLCWLQWLWLHSDGNLRQLILWWLTSCNKNFRNYTQQHKARGYWHCAMFYIPLWVETSSDTIVKLNCALSIFHSKYYILQSHMYENVIL